MAETMVINVAARFQDETDPEMSRSKRKIDEYNEKLRKVEEQIDRLGKEKIKPKADLEDRATSKLEKIMRTSKSLAGKTFRFAVKAVDYATAPLRKVMNMVTSLKGIIAMVTAKLAIDKTLSQPIALADSYASAKIGFSTLFRSEEKAQKMMDDIDNFAKTTPFKTSGVIANAQKMIAMGWNPDDIIKDLETIGDAAAATGKGDEGLDRIILALAQIKSKGKLSSEELNQLAESGISAKRYLAEGLGYGSSDEGMMKLSKDLESGAIGANKAIELITQGMKEYQGMMDTTAKETVSGIRSNIEDTFEIAIFRKWGMGLQDGAKRGLGAVAEFLDANEDRLNRFGDKAQQVATILSTNVANAAETALAKILEVSESPEFAAASIGGKAKMLFDGAIGEPISDWWKDKGKAQAENIATDFGKLLGVGIVKGVGEGIKGIALDASTLLPGGEKASGSSLLSTAALGFGAYKLGAGKLLSKLFSGKNAAKVAGANLAKTVSEADVVQATKTSSALGKFFRSVGDDLLVDAARLRPKLAKIGGSMKGLLKGSWLSLLMSGAAVAQADDKLGEAAKQSGSLAGGLAGGKLGAMLGTLIAPGIGTAIGSALGSIGGFVGGEKLMDKIIGDFDVGEFVGELATGTRHLKTIRDSLSESTEKAKTMASNYKDINDCLWKYQYLQDILNDPESNRTAEDRKRIQEEINDLVKQLHDFYPNLISQYDVENGKLSANLATIKEIAAIDRDRARNELETEIGNQKKEFEKNDVAERFAESNQKIAEGTAKAKEMEEALTRVQSLYADITLALAEKDELKGSGNWTEYTQKLTEITTKMEEVNAIMEEFNLKTYKPGVNGAEKFADGGYDKFVEERQKVVDAITEEYQLNDQLKATYQELYDSQKALIELDLGGTIEETAAKYDTLSEEQKKAFDKALTQIEALQMEMNQLTEKDHIVNIKVVKTQAYGADVANATSWRIGKTTAMPYADGGILNKPHLGLVAEDGAEAIIPLSSKRRQRGLDLWAAAGKALGVRAYADGGMPTSYRDNSSGNAAILASNAANMISGTNTPSITLGGVEVNLNIPNGVNDADGILQAIREQMPDIANEICRYIAINMAKIKGNVVTTGGV